ncbi:hypothetical protein ACI78Q_06800 [Geodermatophilus sp. SYSU D00705]
MRLPTAWLLAAPGSAAGSTRTRLVAAGTAVAGGLLIAALAVLRVPTVAVQDVGTASIDPTYSPLVHEAGLRPGVVTGFVLLLLPALVLTWQAVTTGSARRAAVHRALAVAGAAPGELRLVAAVDAGAAALLGGALTGPVYLVLWLVFGASAGPVRLLPPLGAADLAAWLLVAVLAAGVGAAAGARAAARRPRRRPRTAVRLAAVGLAVAALFAAVQPTGLGRQAQVVVVCAAVVALLGTVLLAGSAWVEWRHRRLVRSRRPVDVLAAGGLRALAGPAGRAAGAVTASGVALGVTAALAGVFARLTATFDPLAASGLLLAASAAALAVLAATAAMALAAADDLVTNARSLASVAALGAEPAVLEHVQLRRLTATTVTPLVAGTLVGGLGYALLDSGFRPSAPVGFVLVTAVVAGVLARGLCALVTRALRGRLRDAADATNLRIA